MTNADIIVNLATMIAEQRLEISELKTEVEHLHHELIVTMSEADTPQTETKGVRYCNECKWFRNKQVCGRCRSRNLFAEADTPQTDRPCDKCEWHKEYGRCIFEYCHYEYEQAHKDTPQTDTHEIRTNTHECVKDMHDKTSPNSSEKPNNCEDLQDWKDRMWAEAIVTEPTISKMEQVDKDINVRSKDEPQIQLTARCLNCNNAKACKEKHWDGCVYEPKDEKTCETCRHWKYIAHEWQCEACKCQGYEPKDEPQTEYERASEQREHDILYEPTYNPEDGSM